MGKSGFLCIRAQPGEGDNMTVLIVDGQGGKVGRALVSRILEKYPQTDLIAVGTNTLATANMLKGGAQHAATGENAVVVACRRADVIIGPIGIVIADSLYGEITPKMATAVAQNTGVRILIPFNQCDNLVAGLPNLPLNALIDDAMAKFDSIMNKEGACRE